MPQRFQSFWWGESLSPYEWLSLKSFVDLGHAFDLYTFDPQIAVPSGVRVCDASAVAGRDELFVYEEGFGKGSPAAFANMFRYKLLSDKGGWWVDTDVVCLSDHIPDCTQFIARQDAELVNNAVMFFEPRHPVMIRCLELAAGMGRSVRWGDTGPRLLTQVLQELGQMDSVLAAPICYPVHHSEAVDVLRPSKTADIAKQLATSRFLHLWNEMLKYNGIRKTCLPPRGSTLRQLIERHRIGGWTGEYDEAGLERLVYLQADVRVQQDANRRLEAELGRRAEESRRLEFELRDRISTGDRLRAELDAMRRSRSWRVTKPLRALRRRLASVRRSISTPPADRTS